MKKIMFNHIQDLLNKSKKLEYDHRYYYDQRKALEEDIDMVKERFISTFGISKMLKMVNNRLKHVWFVDESDFEED
jgi:hypothetical protein